jgi:hypothetical protein
MSTNVLDQPVSISALLPSRIFGRLIVLFLLLDGARSLVPWPAVAAAIDRMGYGSSEALARILGAVSAACMALTMIPPTSIVGAVLWTGYLGDAVVAHLRIF